MRISSLFHGEGFDYPAALYAVSAPFSKLLLAHIPATLMAGFLYIGAGMGMAAAAFIRKIGGTKKEESRFFFKTTTVVSLCNCQNSLEQEQRECPYRRFRL